MRWTGNRQRLVSMLHLACSSFPGSTRPPASLRSVPGQNEPKQSACRWRCGCKHYLHTPGLSPTCSIIGGRDGPRMRIDRRLGRQVCCMCVGSIVGCWAMRFVLVCELHASRGRGGTSLAAGSAEDRAGRRHVEEGGRHFCPSSICCPPLACSSFNRLLPPGRLLGGRRTSQCRRPVRLGPAVTRGRHRCLSSPAPMSPCLLLLLWHPRVLRAGQGAFRCSLRERRLSEQCRTPEWGACCSVLVVKFPVRSLAEAELCGKDTLLRRALVFFRAAGPLSTDSITIISSRSGDRSETFVAQNTGGRKDSAHATQSNCAAQRSRLAVAGQPSIRRV